MTQTDQKNNLTRQFLEALMSHDSSPYTTLLDEDATLRIYGYDGLEAHRSRDRIVERLTAESANWPDPTLTIFNLFESENKTAVEFRIQVTENGRYIEYNRSAFFTFEGESIKSLELYCPEPIPSAHRKDYIAPADLSEEELGRLFDSQIFHHDARAGIPPGVKGLLSLRRLWIGSGGPHPGDNGILGVRWTAEEANANIQAIIDYHLDKNIGFTWTVSPYDTPGDLTQRLEKHGLVLAGEQAIMALIGLETIDIPTNSEIRVAAIDPEYVNQIEAAMNIVAVSFNWTKAQIERRRKGFFEIAKIRNANTPRDFLAYLKGQPVGHGRINLSGSTAHLAGASTLPEFRGLGVYSTLLKHRLEIAHQFGYHIATIEAQPMSKPIVGRYGFKVYATSYIYAWMPVMDMDIINSLVQDT
jgi:ketosteroid isomerase-like protein/GNAT superfamily N-acetyltransferase